MVKLTRILRDSKAADDVAGLPVREVIPNDDKTHRFLTTHRYPIYYMPITKCGSTYMKNLMYALDHDAPHSAGDGIHDHAADLRRADDTPRWMIRRSPMAFTVLRDPVKRFLSLYFDKIYGTGPRNFPDLRIEIAEECGLDLSPGLSVSAHRTNCLKLIAWLSRNIDGDTDIPVNPHWRPQMARASAVAHLKIGFLTTDGLDWQIPHYLGPVIPHIRDVMAMIESRNKTPYPVPPENVADQALVEAVHAVYAEDTAKYNSVAKWWAKREGQQDIAAPAVVDKPRLKVMGSYRFNASAVVMPKAGCTYVRNLFYAMDHGRPHADPSQIASDNSLRYRDMTRDELTGGANVIVLRDPYARFFSLYFDKVWGDRQQAFPWIARQLSKNRRFRAGQELSPAEHHDNCCRFIGYLNTRFNERDPADLNPHWQPQTVKADRARDFGLTPLLLEDFEAQFTQVAGNHIRALDEAFANTRFRNKTEKPIDPAELLSPWIKERLQELYGDDIALYARIKAGWDATGTPPEL